MAGCELVLELHYLDFEAGVLLDLSNFLLDQVFDVGVVLFNYFLELVVVVDGEGLGVAGF